MHAQVNGIVKKDVDSFVSLLITKFGAIIETNGSVIDDRYEVKVKFPDTFNDESMKDIIKYKDSKYILLKNGWRSTVFSGGDEHYKCSFRKMIENDDFAFISIYFISGGSLYKFDNNKWGKKYILTCSGYTLN